VHVNGKLFGHPDAGTDMTFDFGQLIAHAAKTRRLGAGSIVGSGTVSNRDRAAGSTCLAERRMLETLEQGKPMTSFLSFGDRVRIEMLDAAGRSIFGAIDQRVVGPPDARTGRQPPHRAGQVAARGSRAAAPAVLRERRLGDAPGRGSIPVHNPATGAQLGTVPAFDAAATERAVAAAHAAFPAWAAKTAKERAAILKRWNELILANAADLAKLMTAEQGKPLAESKGEIAYAASFVEWFAEEAKRVYGDVVPGHQADKRILVLRQPVGVVAAITPWNFPAAMITRKVAPALAAGCTGRMQARDADAPTPRSRSQSSRTAPAYRPGVLNIVTGPGARDRRRADRRCARAQALVHGLDRDRQAPDGAVF
jgi:hypothetical protein